MNKHAVELGRLGGRRGGPARAASLSPERRSEIARTGAASRWGRKHRLARLRDDRLHRRRVALKIAAAQDLDAGDVEHALFNLTLSPAERLARCLAASK